MLILFYLLGGLGAGDVKFMAAVGCVKGAEFVFTGGVYGAVIGGLAGIVILTAQKRLSSTLKAVFTALFLLLTFRAPEALKFDAKKATYLPYTVFLSAGMLLRLAGIGHLLPGLTR
jgi:prepilin peptidase CpaA